MLRALRPFAGRSALTAALVSRLLSVAASDAGRLRDAARLRGPGAAEVGPAPMARRLLAGSLDRAVDVAATLELRGYGLGAPAAERRRSRSRYDRRFYAIAALVLVAAVAGKALGADDFHAYPTIQVGLGPGTLALAGFVVLTGFATRRRKPKRRAAPDGWRPPVSELAIRRGAPPALSIEGLSYTYPHAGACALDAVSLDLAPGEFVLLAGRSAGGKSTLLKAACGLVPHFHGGEIEGSVGVAGIDALATGPESLLPPSATSPKTRRPKSSRPRWRQRSSCPWSCAAMPPPAAPARWRRSPSPWRCPTCSTAPWTRFREESFSGWL